MSTLQAVELGVLGPLQVRKDGTPVVIPGAKPRAILTMLGLHSGSVVSAETLIELLWGDDPPRTAAKALPTHISALRRALGDGFVLTEGTGWTLAESEVDASRYKSAARLARDAAAAGDTSQAVSRFAEALALWRGIPELPDGRRGTSEKTRWVEGHAALVEDRADALLATGRAAEIIGELEAAVAEVPLRERRWGQLMLALYRAGRQGDALSAYQRARTLLADELGIDPGPNLRRLEAAIVGQDAALEMPAAQDLPTVTRTVTFLLTDIEGSTAAWEADADAMAVALARHDELVEQVVTSRGGRLIKTRGEGDATFSVFERASTAANAAIELQDAIFHEPWRLKDPMRIRVALHTGEVELRDGDYFGRAVNRAARLRSLAIGGQILCSGAIAELVIDSLPDDVVLADLGMRQLKNLARPEHVFELRLETSAPPQKANDAPIERPALPAVLTGPGPFVGRGRELAGLVSAWQTALAGGTHAVLIAGEPGVGKTRLAGEWSQQAYQLEAIVLYGRCDEDLGAPYQPFAEALRSLMPCVGTSRLRAMRGVEALLPLVPGLTDVLPDLAAPTRADPETERYALFDAVVALLEIASTSAPVVLVLDDLHWAAKPTLLLLRHLLRFGDRARVQIVGTYRSTDLDRSHPLAAMLADLHRGAGSGTFNRLTLSGLDEDDVTAYVTEAGYDDEELARALASVTGGNPFFLIEALRHVDETGGVWDPTTLPQGVRETVSRRLSRLQAVTNDALAAAAVVGSRFALDLVEKVVEQDLVDPFDEACKAGIVIEEPGGRYRFNHAIVRQSLLAELPSVRRMRLHQRIAATLENEPGADDELLAELAHHYFECAWAGNAAKAVAYCRRAGDQAVARLGYEGAADLYGQALHALDEIDDELPDRDDQAAELLVARCEALLAAGDVASAAGAVSKLQGATVNSARLAAWATCFDGQLSMLVHPERLDEVETALGLAAQKLAELDDAAGEANAHTVRAACLARLGRIADSEIALDDALTAARRARDHRRVNAVLAGAPLAALWGPNPVPRAGGRCLDVVRLLRITTESPAVEATSTRCQALLEAFRGRAEAARRMIDSARRTVSELGLRHALLEVEQFAGIIELVADDPAAAEPHLRQAYNGFRRMGLDADTAETAALLGRTYLALDRDAESDELCLESERLAGHALKACIAWRTLRALLLSRSHDHDEARHVAEAAVALAERTDALVDHGDACASLATVLDAGGDAAGARAAAERAVDLYERKGAAALTEKARRLLGERDLHSVPRPPEPTPVVELDNACIRAGKRVAAAINREAWDEFEQSYAPEVFSESRRKVIGFTHAAGAIVPPGDWAREIGRVLGASGVRLTARDIAVRGERLALARMVVGTADTSLGAPQDEFLQIYGIDEEGRVSLQIFFDLEDMDAAIAELDAAAARFEAEPHRQEGFDAEWRVAFPCTVQGDLVSRCELFEEVDVDVALAQFEELSQPARRLENAATRVFGRLYSYVAVGDWDAVAQISAENVCVDDRRRVVNAGILHGRDANIKDAKATVDVGFTMTMLDVLATRGGRLALTGVRVSGRDPEAIQNDALQIMEIDAEEHIACVVVFDLNDFEAAIAELDARYIADEAAAHASTWSVITGFFAAHNRREIAATASDVVTIDHRRVAGFAPGEGVEYIRAGWDLGQNLHIYIETAHRLNNLGAVFTYAGYGTSDEGFDAEWRGTTLMTVDGEMLTLMEVFDEGDLDAAVAKFDQLSQPAPRLENAASQVAAHVGICCAARDWDSLAELYADDISTDDRRRVVNAGVIRGRDAQIANMRVLAAMVENVTSTVIATRGERLALNRISSLSDEEFGVELLSVIEVGADDRATAGIQFDPDDLDAAFAELDARYLAGEAAPYAQTWSTIRNGYAALNRHELPPTTPDFVNNDHRRGGSAFTPGDLLKYVRVSWDDSPHNKIYVEAVHRLTNLGAVVTSTTHGASVTGFDAQWREIGVVTVEGDMFSRCELFDETDFATALAKFEELSRPTPRPDNAAIRVCERYLAHYAAHDWDGLTEILAANFSSDDRRRVVSAGVRHGRDAQVANMQAISNLAIANVTLTKVATRGERLVLQRVRFSDSAEGTDAFLTERLGVGEIDADERIVAFVSFDLDDVDAAFAELDARYLAGEAAAHSHTWSAVARVCEAINRQQEYATTPDWVNVDHRRAINIAPGELFANMHAGWDLAPDLVIRIEAVHRLTNLGAVVTVTARGSSRDGFDAEWPMILLLTVEGNRISRCEVFDESDLDAALARFAELQLQPMRLENAASRMYEHFLAYFSARDWAALAEILAEESFIDDRRPVINAGLWDGREDVIANLQAFVEAAPNITSVIATRGECLALTRIRSSNRDHGQGEFVVEMLNMVEIDSDERIVAQVEYDVDDIDAAIAELEARYLAGEAATHARTWSAIAAGYAALNRHEVPPTTPDWVNVDHRRGIAFTSGELAPYIRATFDVAPDIKIRIEVVHQLTTFGAVISYSGQGTSQEGFDAVWRETAVFMVDGDLVSRCEMYDEADLNAALARLEELSRPAPRLENRASQTIEQYGAYFKARDWTAFAELLADDMVLDDRRRVVNAGVRRRRDVHIADLRAAVDVGAETLSSRAIAARGERLALAHVRAFNRGMTGEVGAEWLGIVELDADERIVAIVAFGLDDIDVAFAELEARYLAGEAAANAQAWSVIARNYVAFNGREFPSQTVNSVYIDHRPLVTNDATDLTANIRAIWDLMDVSIYIAESVHRLSESGAVVTQVLKGTSKEGLDIESRMIDVFAVEGNLVSRIEVFDEADLDAALARFDELSPSTPSLGNVATETWTRVADAFNHRDVDGLLALASADSRYEDRRKGLRDAVEGPGLRKALHAVFETAPRSWWMEAKPIAIRGSRLSLTRECYRDIDETARPIAVELLHVMELGNDDLMHYIISFDPDDINDAFAELTARWIASGQVAYPKIIESVDRIVATINRHDWGTAATHFAGAEYVNHRQPAHALNATIADWLSSLQTTGSHVPDLRVELAEILARSAIGIVGRMALKGTPIDGTAIENSFVVLTLIDGERVTRLEAFDDDRRDLALARLQELNRPV